MINKVRILKKFFSENGMIINESKTNFSVICGTEVDTESLLLRTRSIFTLD